MPNTSGLGTNRASAIFWPPPWRPVSISCCRWLSWRYARAGRSIAIALSLSLFSVSPPTWPHLLPIGGDFFEFRPLDFYWPLLAVPAAEGIALLGSGISTGLRRFPRVPRWTAAGGTYTIALFLPVLFYANAIQGFLLFEDSGIRAQTGVAHAELNEENAGWLLAAPGMPVLVAISNDMRRLCGLNWVGIRFSQHRGYVNIITLGWQAIRTDGAQFHPR